MFNRLRQMIKPKGEARASGTGFTAQVMEARESYIAGRSGLAETTAAVQGCVSLWENGLAQADVTGTDVLTPQALGIAARSLAWRGEAVFLIRDQLIPVSDWDLTTRDGLPLAYRLTISEAGGGRAVTALADEVLHITIGTDAVTPWAGSAPLHRANLSASLLHAVESALAGVYTDAPIGSQVVPYPESPEQDRLALANSFRGKRGRVLLRESVSTTAAGGPTPQTDWKPSELSPDLQKTMTAESWQAARESICHAFGVLPALLSAAATGPVVREAQRHLAQWQLQPIAALIASEASAKLGTSISLDTMTPLQAYDAGGRARALSGVMQALAAAKDSGLTDDQVATALKFAGIPGDT